MAKITRRDLRIAAFLTEGRSTSSIAEELSISVSEVHSTMRRLRKAGIKHAPDHEVSAEAPA